MKEPKTYIINMGAEAGFWGMPKEKIWDAEIELVSKEDYNALHDKLKLAVEALEFYSERTSDPDPHNQIAREALAKIRGEG